MRKFTCTYIAAVIAIGFSFSANARETVVVGGVATTCDNSCVVNGTKVSDSAGGRVHVVFLPKRQ
ncbi:hypothetical protein [Stenotrophomonas terrae]|uniref:hypothetical protein n=1 Tax=Stenotrophomonas terrae TaxID=405446 RepID=UPI00128ED62D|nr:hypothetical protein [Stenotrophomonas terrae]